MTALEFLNAQTELQAKRAHAEVKVGEEAFNLSANRTARWGNQAQAFEEGDTFVLEKANFKALPMRTGGEDVPRCNVEVTTKSGDTRAHAVFCGSFTKALRDLDGNTVMAKVTGVDITGCVSEMEIWNKLLGKKVTVTKATLVKFLKKDFATGIKRPDEGIVCEFNVE